MNCGWAQVIPDTYAIYLHDTVLFRFGGAMGIRAHGSLSASLYRPHTHFGDTPAFPTIFEKAAALMHGIITSHPFVDGNKRTGYALANLVLSKAGIHLDTSDAVKFKIVMDVALGHSNVESTATALKKVAAPVQCVHELSTPSDEIEALVLREHAILALLSDA